jgi:hypothetical protein
MALRRSTLIGIACGLLLASTAGPTLAAEPATSPHGERALTAGEEAASDRKVAAAEAFVSGARALGKDLSTLACVPNGQAAATTIAPGCGVPQGSIPVEARDQVLGHYCGPAVAQVISNYAWAVPTGKNAFTQAEIARWMGTDRLGLTDVFSLEAGLETGTRGSPRRPANWDWLVSILQDTDGDGTLADQLHDYARFNVSGWRMPLAVSVKPHAVTSNFNLPSWPNPVSSIGHWIAIYGWYALFIGNDTARLYYTDSSRDEGGATGKFWIPTRHMAALVGEHHRRIVW